MTLENVRVDWSQIELVSPRLRLRPFMPADADEVLACITPSLTRYMSFDPPQSKMDFKGVWQGWLKENEKGKDFNFVVRIDATRAFVGLCSLHRTGTPEPEVGIWIRESEHGRGYGREAVRTVVCWGAAAFGSAGFIYPVADLNRPSRSIAESLGGVEVGRSSGVKYDSVTYRIPARS
ncbi:GNAT family N-acetyltransferase [Xanthomonas arboricola]|nr:GNAT family N-acetyltransferase [Xanthomonas arboricola]